MTTVRIGLIAIAACGYSAVASATDKPQNELVSVNNDGRPGNGVSAFPSISGDGRYVAYQSSATNLTSADTGGEQQIYVADRKSGKVELVSRNSHGAAGNEESRGPSISLDGRFVTFFSRASNLVKDDTNEQQDTFVFDRKKGKIERVSVSSKGRQGTGEDDSEELEEHGGAHALEGHAPSISADGRYVTFWTGLNGLVADDDDDVIDVFLRDRKCGTTTRISRPHDGAPANGPSRRARIAPLGNLVVFDSEASNLVTGDTNGKKDIFGYHVDSEELSLLTRSITGGPIDDDALEPHPDFMGRFIVFTAWATNLVAKDLNKTRDAFLLDRYTGAVELVSVKSDGSQFAAPTFEAGPSPNGRYVVMTTLAGVVPVATANFFIFDRISKKLEQLNVDSQGNPAAPLVIGPLDEPVVDPSTPQTSSDGRFVAFWTTAPNIVRDDTNGVADVFVRDRGKQKK